MKENWQRTLCLMAFFAVGFYIAFGPYIPNHYYNILGSIAAAAGVLIAITMHRVQQMKEAARILKEKSAQLHIRVHHLQSELKDTIPLCGGTVRRDPGGVWDIGFPMGTFTTPGIGVTHYHLSAHPEYFLVYGIDNRGRASLVISKINPLFLSGTTPRS